MTPGHFPNFSESRCGIRFDGALPIRCLHPSVQMTCAVPGPRDRFPDMKNLISPALLALVLASCQTSVPTDLTGIRSVGIANGMGGKLTRNKIGTTVFNNDYESAEVPVISAKVSESAARN